MRHARIFSEGSPIVEQLINDLPGAKFKEPEPPKIRLIQLKPLPRVVWHAASLGKHLQSDMPEISPPRLLDNVA